MLLIVLKSTGIDTLGPAAPAPARDVLLPPAAELDFRMRLNELMRLIDNNAFFYKYFMFLRAFKGARGAVLEDALMVKPSDRHKLNRKQEQFERITITRIRVMMSGVTGLLDAAFQRACRGNDQ